MSLNGGAVSITQDAGFMCCRVGLKALCFLHEMAPECFAQVTSPPPSSPPVSFPHPHPLSHFSTLLMPSLTHPLCLNLEKALSTLSDTVPIPRPRDSLFSYSVCCDCTPLSTCEFNSLPPGRQLPEDRGSALFTSLS